jgi:tetratricopeptide (TPR) repeat protein
MGFTVIKWILTIFIFTFFLRTIMAQENGTNDSLFQRLQNTHNLKSRARLLLKISKEEELRNPEKSLDFARQALQESRLAMYDSAEVRALIQIGVNLSRLNKIKEAIEIGGLVVEKASEQDMLLEVADGRNILAVAYASVGDYDRSSRLYFENLKLYEKLNEKRLIGRTLGNIGADFISQQDYEKAMEYANKALIIAQESDDQLLITDMYNNIAAIFQVSYHDYRKALQYYIEALNVAIKIDDFPQQGINMINIGRVYMELEKSDSAYYYINQSLVLFQKVNNLIMMADSYLALCDYYFSKKDYFTGKEFANRALEIGERYQMLQTIYEASGRLQEIFITMNDSANAYKYLVIKTVVNDSLSNLQSQKALFRAELQYNQEKVIKDHKLKQQKNYFIFGFVILGLLSGLFIVLLLNSRQKIRIKNTILAKEKAEADLKFKSKELSINLLALLKKNELIADIRQKFTTLEKTLPNNEVKEVVKKLNNEIRLSSDDRLWQEFSMRFKEINSAFYERLLNKFPDLTQNELKLCAYLRLNMSTKEIADLTGQSPETLGKARYRLRKKFALTNLESNLVMFLSQI